MPRGLKSRTILDLGKSPESPGSDHGKFCNDEISFSKGPILSLIKMFLTAKMAV